MNSSANDDEFADNPFRSGGDDFFDTQPQQTAPPPQQQQQQFTNVQQPPQQQFHPQPDQFQNNFPPPQQQARQPVNNMNMNMAGGGLSGPMDSNNQGLNQPQAPTSRLGACMMCLSLDSYRAYFDIDAEDIVIRIKSAVLDCYKPEHFRNNVVGVNKTDSLKGPDLYGPFWITMTLIFFVAVSFRLPGIGCLLYMSDDPFCLNSHFYVFLYRRSLEMSMLTCITAPKTNSSMILTTCCMLLGFFRALALEFQRSFGLQLSAWVCSHFCSRNGFVSTDILSQYTCPLLCSV